MNKRPFALIFHGRAAASLFLPTRFHWTEVFVLHMFHRYDGPIMALVFLHEIFDL